MFESYFPAAHVKSVFDIDYAKLYSLGIRGIIFDIDNTLVHHGDDATEEIEELFKKIHAANLKTVLLSDNSEARVKRFVRNIDTPYVYSAKKPAREGYERALELLGTEKENTIAVGDRIFIDIVGANSFGIRSVLVDYIRLKRFEWCGFKRILEKMILIIFHISRKPAKIDLR